MVNCHRNGCDQLQFCRVHSIIAAWKTLMSKYFLLVKLFEVDCHAPYRPTDSQVNIELSLLDCFQSRQA